MFLAASQPVAILLALLSMFCWGSWSIALVLMGDRLRFESFYFDYTAGVLIVAVCAALSLGLIDVPGCEHCAARFVPDDFEVHFSRMLFSAAGGAIFNLANIMLTKGIQMVGLAVAFPLCIGTALVLGTLLTRLLQAPPHPSSELLFSGVGLGFLAVCATSLVHHLKDRAVRSAASLAAAGVEEGEGPAAAGPLWKLGVCLLGGLFMSLWNPLTSVAQRDFVEGAGLSPYGSFFFFSVGIALSTLFLLPLFLCFPLDRAPRAPLSAVSQEYRKAPFTSHLYGLIGGAVWAVGTLSNAIAGQQLSLAASYAIGQAAPMVSVLWGVFFFREFAAVPGTVQGLLVVVVILYMGSIALIAMSQS